MNDTVSDHVKLGIAALLASVYGVTLEQWVGLITIIYLLLQIVLLLPKYHAMLKRCWERWRK